MSINIGCPYLFLSYILENSDYTIISLSKLLDIPIKRLLAVNKLTRADCMRIGELKGRLEID